MKMKNVLMILVTLAVVFAMAGAVSGEPGFAADDDTMIVNYTVQDSYTVTIPPDVTFNDGLSSEHFVNATNVLINPDKKLVVNLTSNHYIDDDGIYYLVCGDNSWIRYYINVTTYNDVDGNVVGGQESPVTNEDHFLNVLSGAKYPGKNERGSAGVGGFVKLTFKTTQEFIDNATKSGNHEDTLTFMLDVVSQSQQQS